MSGKFLPDFLSRPVEADRILLPATPADNLFDNVERDIFNDWRVDLVELPVKNTTKALKCQNKRPVREEKL